MNLLKKHWPWLLLIVIPLWIIAVVGELMDAKLLQDEGVTVEGKIASAQWFAGRRGGRHLTCKVVWSHGGREYSKEFDLPSHIAVNYADNEGNLRETRLGVRCAPSKPEVAALVIIPPDPVWVGAILACVGLCVLCGVICFLYHNGFWTRQPGT